MPRAVGVRKNRVIVVAVIITLDQNESVRINPDRIGNLYRQLGDAGAEDVVCRAIEELAARLALCGRLWQDGDHDGLRKCVRSLVAISDQIGMTALARVAGDVTKSIDQHDVPAADATLFRLLRIGECSLTAVWDLQDLSV